MFILSNFYAVEIGRGLSYNSNAMEIRRNVKYNMSNINNINNNINNMEYTLGIDIGSTTVKVAVMDAAHHLQFADYELHFANIQKTLGKLMKKAQ